MGENVLDGRGASLADQKNGIMVRGLWPEWGLSVQQVLIWNNVITGWSRGILLLGDLETDMSGNTFVVNCFNADYVDPSTGGSTGVEFFAAGLPLDPAVSKVVLRQGSTDLGQVTANAHTPVVTLTAPNSGELLSDGIVVQWIAYDDDPGDELAYNLWYSNDDGATWLPEAAGITGTNSFDLDLSWVPGSENARMRVEVSGGFHTASDESDGSFSVPNKAPWVAIALPEAESVVTPPLTL